MFDYTVQNQPQITEVSNNLKTTDYVVEFARTYDDEGIPNGESLIMPIRSKLTLEQAKKAIEKLLIGFYGQVEIFDISPRGNASEF